MNKLAHANTAYRSALLRKRSELLATLGIRFDTIAESGRVAEDDQAQLSHDEFIAQHVNGIGYRVLRDVEEALLRMDRGEYGLCARCEGAVPEKRLRAVPWARYCVACQELAGGEEESGGQSAALEAVGAF